MAFTTREFFMGVLFAWLWFALLMLPASLFTGALAPIALLVAGAYIAPWVPVVIVVFTPLAFLLGRALRREQRFVRHVLWFTGFGIFVSGVMTAVMMVVHGTGDFWILGPYSLAAATAILLGWRSAAKRALNADLAADTIREPCGTSG